MNKKFIAAVLAVSMLCSNFIVNTPVMAAENNDVNILADTAHSTKEIFVSNSGNDSNAGTTDAPVRTLERAQELVREQNDGTSDILVTVMEGTYYLDNTLEFTSEDGGTEDTSVTWHGSGEIIISGNQIIDGWELYDEENLIYSASVPEDFNTRQLYVNGEKALRSRSIAYGENTYDHLERTCELGINARNNREFYFYADEVKDWNNYEEVELHILTAWIENVLRLKSYDDEMNYKPVTINNGGSEGNVAAAAVKVQEPESEKMFNRAHPDITGSTLGYASRSYYYFENAYEFIDEEYEWYLDTTKNTLYFKAPEDMDVEETKFEVPVLETLVCVSGTKEELVTNLSFKGLTFEGSTWLRPSEEGLVGAQASHYMITTSLQNKSTVYHPASAFYVEYAQNFELDSCRFRNTGATAVDFFCGVSDSRIQNCEVYNCAGNGISVAKFVQDEYTEIHEAYNPDDKSEICSAVMVVNNKVHDIGTEMEGSVGIAAGYPERIVIAHNEIYNTPYSGISVGFGWSDKDNAMKENVIFRNRIYDIGLVLCDFGGIYTLSKQPDSICAGNYISDVSRQSWFDYGYAAMYFDEQTEGYIIKDNVLFNIGDDAWGGGINFNGCAAKNKTLKNINIDGTLTSEAELIADKAGVKADKTCEDIKADIEQYKKELQNPVEPYDPSDYRIEKEMDIVDAWANGAGDSTDAFYAIDGNLETSFYLEGQTEASMKDQYLVVELDGESLISKVKIDRQFNAAGTTGDNNYWTDWCLAVGCELQGSFDGEKWETIGTMNSWPDGTGERDNETIRIAEPKPYKYVRYIRTKYKTGSDYAVWRWADTDGGNRLNVLDISFYTYEDAYQVKVQDVSATDCDADSKPEYAVDGDNNTTYTLSGQTQESMGKQYLLIETDGTKKIERIIIRRQYNAAGMTTDYDYWTDWCLAVGCEVQGSLDGEEWETIGIMNSWPDGTGETSKEIIDVENPKTYKYIRYIRTKYKTSSDYAAWRWPDSDGGNRLNVKEIELYTSEKPVNDKSALEAAVADSVPETDKDKYIPITWDEYAEALATAKATLEKENATQEEIDDAASALTSAQNKLTLKPDKTALQTEVDAALPPEDAEKYTEDSWAEYQKALDQAKEVLANENARQTAVDSALTQLQNAKEELVLIGDEPNPPDLPYVDVAESDWFYDAVEYTFVEGLMTGMDAAHFGPYGTLSRAQFALILYRMENEPEVDTSKTFTDITGDEWYGKAVLWAAENGIVTGYQDGNFGPADMITREQMAVMMYRYANYLKEDTSTKSDTSIFTDASSVSGFATDAMKWANGTGIITGKENGTKLDPQGNTARCEAATIIMRYMNAYAK